jgi:hypothetical protein
MFGNRTKATRSVVNFYRVGVVTHDRRIGSRLSTFGVVRIYSAAFVIDIFSIGSRLHTNVHSADVHVTGTV